MLLDPTMEMTDPAKITQKWQSKGRRTRDQQRLQRKKTEALFAMQ